MSKQSWDRTGSGWGKDGWEKRNQAK